MNVAGITFYYAKNIQTHHSKSVLNGICGVKKRKMFM